MPRKTFIPARYQPGLPMGKLIREEAPGEDAVPMDVVFVGGGPAGLAGAIELARLAKKDAEEGGGLGAIEIGVLEKAERLGDHCLSGAVVNPTALRELFPEIGDEDFPFRTRVRQDRVYVLTEKASYRIPTPPSMNNHGNYVASICEIVRWLGEKAEELGVNLFTGFPADSLLVEGGRVQGVRTAPGGLNKEGEPGGAYVPPTDVAAKVTVLSEGTRGTLAQAFFEWQGVASENPQIYALGVKELWEVKRPLDAVVHTMGWPLPRHTFGGSWMYPMSDDLVSLGLVAGLDYLEHSFDVHVLLQHLKKHPLFRKHLEGGEMLEWGAKTIPEGGFYSLPDRLHGDGILVVGDAAGFVDVPSLKGIHYAVMSGIFAARAIFDALKADDTSSRGLRKYDELVRGSFIREDLYRTRNMRLGFKSGFFLGGIKALLSTLTGGRFPGGKTAVQCDAAEPRQVAPAPGFTPEKGVTIAKLDGVFASGNNTRDDMPSHLILAEDIPPEVCEFYVHMCPAAVYEVQDGKLVVNFSNCVDCKTTDVLGPRWTPREGGAGTKYKRM